MNDAVPAWDAPHRARTRSEAMEHRSAPCEHALRGRGALLHVVRARAPRAWNVAPRRASTAPRAWSIAPRRASTRSEGLEHCSTSCEHCSEGVEHCSTSCEHCSEGVEHCSTSCEHGYNLAARRNLPAGSFVPLTRSRRSRDFRLRRPWPGGCGGMPHEVRPVAGVELAPPAGATRGVRARLGRTSTGGAGAWPGLPAGGRLALVDES